MLHTIFFHRFFTPLYPTTHDVLDLTLPYVSDQDIESLVEQRVDEIVRQLDVANNNTTTTTTTTSSPYVSKGGGGGGRAQLVVQFLEKKRRKGWFVAKADEETVWETWVIDVALMTARSEPEATRNRRVMEHGLQKAAMKIVALVNRDRGCIPPITTNDSNPFPYQILVNPKSEGSSQKISLF